MLDKTPVLDRSQVLDKPPVLDRSPASSENNPKSPRPHSLDLQRETIIGAVNAELVSKFKKGRLSSEDESEDDSNFKSAISSPPQSSSNSSTFFSDANKEAKDICNAPEKSTSEEKSTQNSAPTSKKSFSYLFDDDDDDELDEFFKPVTPAPETESKTPRRGFYDDDIDSEPVVEKVRNQGLPGGVSSVFGRKLALFDSDSESEDEIQAIINSQGKITSKERASLEENPPIREKQEQETMAQDYEKKSENSCFVAGEDMKSFGGFNSETESGKISIEMKKETTGSEVGDPVVGHKPDDNLAKTNEFCEAVNNSAKELKQSATVGKPVEVKPELVPEEEAKAVRLPVAVKSSTVLGEGNGTDGEDRNVLCLSDDNETTIPLNSSSSTADEQDGNLIAKNAEVLPPKPPVKERSVLVKIAAEEEEAPSLPKPKPGIPSFFFFFFKEWIQVNHQLSRSSGI